ncbi:conserved exported hypothetical protein [Hyella patelloides LEGE 07179]|uniref:Uncharacterized protein n=1 Tax=Hyella patelloides LEGE 07179 TaxID=945734 RepID=A0A563VYV3_9CYAN|nr:hypothetical protein [Hyella patelloides]VEP16642.1 conserved exported hypothetical protein [Hyella patelloides LEGE 07179]
MNSKQRLKKIIAPLALGIGLTVGISASAIAHPRDSESYGNYHQRSFIEIQPFRSLNVTPKYHTPLPRRRYDNYDDRYYDRGYYGDRQRRVHRRGFRKPVNDRRYRNRYRDSDRYIRIRIR